MRDLSANSDGLPFASPPPCIWLDDGDTGHATRCFRRTFTTAAAPTDAAIWIYAQLRYALWVNGRFVASGPASHHAMLAPFDRHDLSAYLSVGGNVIAVLVDAPDHGTHQHVPTGEPGLCATVRWRESGGEQVIDTDRNWRVTSQTGWVWSLPRRNWALGRAELFDAESSPRGWRELAFDDGDGGGDGGDDSEGDGGGDSDGDGACGCVGVGGGVGGGWQDAETWRLGSRVAGGVEAVVRPTPKLRHRFVTPQGGFRWDRVLSPVTEIGRDDRGDALGRSIMEMPRLPGDSTQRVVAESDGGGLVVEGLTPEAGVAVDLDLGAFYVGQIVLECDCPGRGVIDVAWGEVGDAGRACCLRKGTSYVDRVVAGEGKLDWRPIGFSGMRYLTLVFRGFAGSVRVRRVGIDAREPDLNWAGNFESDDRTLDAVWRLCERTVRVGTQDALMDCPTREQATYIGDGLPVAQWIARLTGDTRYWRDIVCEQFRRQAIHGLIRSTPFSCLDSTLIDYVLIAVMGTRDYLRWTGDIATVREVLPAARRALGWFDAHRGAEGWLSWRWEANYRDRPAEDRFDPEWPRLEALNLVIDHPGLGWHNPDEAGIDRRGINAGVHALIVLARRAMGALEDAAGEADQAAAQRREADRLSEIARACFYDKKAGAFVDGVRDGQRLTQLSEQTNTLAVLAGWAKSEGESRSEGESKSKSKSESESGGDQDHAREMLNNLIHRAAPNVARSGYYFWIYQLEAMARLNLTREALADIRRLWGKMLDTPTTTCWETPSGDDLDSWCHPWSAVPASFLLTDVLGLGGLEGVERSDQTRSIRPRYDLLAQASGRMFIRQGPCTIRWQPQPLSGGGVAISGQLPEGVEAQLHRPDGKYLATVSGTWHHDVP